MAHGEGNGLMSISPFLKLPPLNPPYALPTALQEQRFYNGNEKLEGNFNINEKKTRPCKSGKNYLTMGVDTSTGTPEVEYSHAVSTADMGEVAAADLVTDVDNPYNGVGNATTCAIKVQPGQTYKVTMSKNAQSGLIEKILVVKR